MGKNGTGMVAAFKPPRYLAEDTVVVFYSDIGGVVSERGYVPGGFDEPVTANRPLRGEKGSVAAASHQPRVDRFLATTTDVKTPWSREGR